MSITNAQLLNEAFRIAGVSKRPMRTPSPDQYAEAILIENLMLDSWNCDPLNIFAKTITAFPLTANQLIYTIGATAAAGNFIITAPGPGAITEANIILPGTPIVIRQPVRILDKEQWAAVRLQALPGAITSAIYPDYNFPLGKVYLFGQPPAGYSLELYTDQLVPAFVATTDTVALPPGYQAAIVYNLAIRLASAFKSEEGVGVSDDDRTIARTSLADIQSRNAPVPHMTNDAAGLNSGRRGGNWNWWRTGMGPG